MQVDCIMHLYALHAFFDFIGSLEFYFDFWGFLTVCGGFLPTLSGRLGKSIRLSGQIWVNLGPLCLDGFGGRADRVPHL